MSRIAKAPRAYQSQLRAAQANETRARILDATVRVMASGIATLSVPAVGVSVPTVYRHFGTKADLLAALYPHVVGRAAYDATRVVVESMSDFRALFLTLFSGLEGLDDLARAAMASPASHEGRRLNMPYRIAAVRRFVAGVAPGASEVNRERITRLVIVLTNSAAMRVWRDYFESTADDAADDVEWAMRAAIAAAGQGADR